jgi:hypothetical protein
MYPKTFFANRQDDTTPGTCFVIMPFAKEFTPTFRAIQRAVEGERGFTCTRTDELLGGGHIIEDILKGIASSELIVADVTGRNANVYYELGIAHMSKPVERVILLSQAVDEIPFDLRQFRHIVYRPGTAGLNALSRELSEAVAAVSKPVHRIFLDQDGKGSLREKLMGSDHCLYEFRIENSFAGHHAAKFLLKVIRHIMHKGHSQEIAFSQGMGLNLGERRPIYRLEWDIALEEAPDGKTCFRIYESQPDPPTRTRARRTRT